MSQIFDVTNYLTFKEMYDYLKSTSSIKKQKEINLLVCRYEIDTLKMAQKGNKTYRGIKFNFYVETDENGKYLTFDQFFIPENMEELPSYKYGVFFDKKSEKLVGALENPFLNSNAFFKFKNVNLGFVKDEYEIAANILVNSDFFEDEFTEEKIEKLRCAFDSLKDEGYEFDNDYISFLMNKDTLFLLKKMNKWCVDMEIVNDISLIFILIEARYTELYN